jgi:hypothetical protein
MNVEKKIILKSKTREDELNNFKNYNLIKRKVVVLVTHKKLLCKSLSLH